MPTSNGIELDSLRGLVDAVAEDREAGRARFAVATDWRGGTRSDTRSLPWRLGRDEHHRDFTIQVDEPCQLMGQDSAPTPLETLMAAFNSCLLIGYVTLCAQQGIELQKLAIHTHGELDLRGAFGIDPGVVTGYKELCYEVRVQAQATRAQLEEIHDAVVATSPLRWNLSHPVRVRSRVVVE